MTIYAVFESAKYYCEECDSVFVLRHLDHGDLFACPNHDEDDD